MRKDKQEILAIGELAIFALAWVLAIVAALNGDRTHSSPGNDIAATGSYSSMIDVLE